MIISDISSWLPGGSNSYAGDSALELESFLLTGFRLSSEKSYNGDARWLALLFPLNLFIYLLTLSSFFFIEFSPWAAASFF